MSTCRPSCRDMSEGEFFIFNSILTWIGLSCDCPVLMMIKFRFVVVFLDNVLREAAGGWREVPRKQLGGRFCHPK
jgi:hypothetical protein